MKKFFLILVVLVMVFLGGSYLASNQIKSAYEMEIKNLKNNSDIVISNEDYEKGLFSSSSIFEIKIKKEDISDILSQYNRFYYLSEDLTLKFKNEIGHNLFSFLTGFKIKTDVLAIGTYKKEFEEVFNSNLFLNIDTSISLSQDGNMKLILKDIKKSKNKADVLIKGFSVNVDFEKSELIKSFVINLKEASFIDNSRYNKMSMAMKGLSTSYETQIPVSLADIDTKVTPSTSKLFIENISLNSHKMKKLDISKIEYNDEISINEKNNTFDMNDDITIKSISYGDILFKEFDMKYAIKKLSIVDLEKFIKKYNKSSRSSNKYLDQKAISRIFSKNPIIELEKLSIKNKKDNKANLSLKAFTKDFDASKEIRFNKKAFNLEGVLLVDSSLKEFLYQFGQLHPMIEGFQIEEKIFTKEQNGLKSVFKYDNIKDDILINGKSSKEIF